MDNQSWIQQTLDNSQVGTGSQQLGPNNLQAWSKSSDGLILVEIKQIGEMTSNNTQEYPPSWLGFPSSLQPVKVRAHILWILFHSQHICSGFFAYRDWP